MNIDNVK